MKIVLLVMLLGAIWTIAMLWPVSARRSLAPRPVILPRRKFYSTKFYST